MPKLYLLGGENVSQRSAKEINQKAFADTSKPLNVLVFPWARASFDKNCCSRKLFTGYMRSLGALSVEYVEYGESADVVTEKMATSNLIYLTGGQPSILIERIKTAGLEHLLETYDGVIVGRSAGALALCSRFISTIRNTSKVRVTPGLGLASITLKVHYTSQKDETMRQLSLVETIFALPQGSALISNNGKFYTMGKVYVFRNGERQLFSGTLNQSIDGF